MFGFGTHGGGGGGGSPCRMSIIRNSHVALSILRRSHVALFILRKRHVALSILRKCHVACHQRLKRAMSPCRFYGSTPSHDNPNRQPIYFLK